MQFDYDGSLALARRLWDTADRFIGAAQERDVARAEAVQRWEGPYAEVFASVRVTDENDSCCNVMAALQEEAVNWAYAWATAVDDQNRIEWAEAVEQERTQRSSLEKFGDWWVGDDSTKQVPEPAPVAVPEPPGFTPTGGFVGYWRDDAGWHMTTDGVCTV